MVDPFSTASMPPTVSVLAALDVPSPETPSKLLNVDAAGKSETLTLFQQNTTNVVAARIVTDINLNRKPPVRC